MWDAPKLTFVTPYASIEKVTAQAQPRADREVLLEAQLKWGGDVIHVRHLRARRQLRIRDLGFDVPGDPHLVVAREDEARLVLCLPSGAAVPDGCRTTLRMGRATLRLSLVADDVDAPRRALPDPRVAFGIITAAALHLVILGLLAHGRAPDGAQDEAALETMQRMVASAEARSIAELAAAKERSEHEALTVQSSSALPKPAAVAGRSVHERGAAGNPGSTKVARGRITRGDDPRAERPGHDEVASFGLLALLAGPEGGNGAGSSAFAAEIGPAAMGNIFGQTIHDAEGAGGLGLSGPGEGGGGLGAGVPLSFIGTIGKANGDGTGQGFGCCGGRVPLHGAHVARAPTIWGGGELQVHGRLPPEAIQRIIRQSFGRLRACYEQGLLRSPDLEGRIAVKFVIDREGDVTMASATESSLGDTSVESCVAKAYEAMSFPKPEGGIVTVVYPIVFARTSP